MRPMLTILTLFLVATLLAATLSASAASLDVTSQRLTVFHLSPPPIPVVEAEGE